MNKLTKEGTIIESDTDEPSPDTPKTQNSSIKKLLELFALLAMIVSIAGCEGEKEKKIRMHRHHEDASDVIDRLEKIPDILKYVHDRRTNKCFAILTGYNEDSAGFELLPCDEGVLSVAVPIGEPKKSK